MRDEINETYLLKDNTVVEETEQLRLPEWGIEYETSFSDHRSEWNRRVVNQCATGMINIHTLQNLLGETEHLQACPKCHNVAS